MEGTSCGLTVAEHGIVGEALIALHHEELKEMGILSAGHRLKLLKEVYNIKIQQDIPLEADDYVPPCQYFCCPS